MIRQGDVLLIEVDALPPRTRKVPRDGGRLILAYGEVTGHAHVVDAPEAEATLLTTTENERFQRLTAWGRLVHEEHAPIGLAPGIYKQVRQQEWTDAMALEERVMDVRD
jgi:hypothetical protein